MRKEDIDKIQSIFIDNDMLTEPRILFSTLVEITDDTENALYSLEFIRHAIELTDRGKELEFIIGILSGYLTGLVPIEEVETARKSLWLMLTEWRQLDLEANKPKGFLDSKFQSSSLTLLGEALEGTIEICCGKVLEEAGLSFFVESKAKAHYIAGLCSAAVATKKFEECDKIDDAINVAKQSFESEYTWQIRYVLEQNGLEPNMFNGF